MRAHFAILLLSSSSHLCIGLSYIVTNQRPEYFASLKVSNNIGVKKSCLYGNQEQTDKSLQGRAKNYLKMSEYNQDDEDDDDDELVEPGELKVSEIKAELKMRGVDFSDCFDRESLVQKLRGARATGKADPSILDQFNSMNKPNSETKAASVEDVDIDAAVGNDGKLPGGMSPDMVQSLMNNPELVQLLQDPKMQECMKIMMTGGQDALEQKMRDDPEMRDKVVKLNEIMGLQ